MNRPRVSITPAAPGTEREIEQPESLWIEWDRIVVLRGGPRAGREARTTTGISIPTQVFEQVAQELGWRKP